MEVFTHLGVNGLTKPVAGPQFVGPCGERRASEEIMRGAGESGMLPLSRLDLLAFSLAAVYVRHHQLRAWNRLGLTLMT